MGVELAPGPAPDATNSSVLNTERLELSFGDDSDAERLFGFVHGEAGRSVTDFLLWDGPEDVEEMAGYFRRHRSGTFVPHGFHWLVRDRTGALTGSEGAAMGSIGIDQRGPVGRCSLGYWLAPPYWGQGVMPEALAAVIQHGFGTLGVVKFEAEVFEGNTRSVALLERLGFRKEGRIRLAQYKRGRWIDELVYGLTRDDHTSGRSGP